MPFPESKIFSIHEQNFSRVALEVFRYQYHHQPIYRKFCESLNRHPENVFSEADIPFLPIQFFKSHQIVSDERKAEIIFESSGTTGSVPSKHEVASLAVYERSFYQTFRKFYGSPDNYCILALLPSYLERKHSSLVYMAKHLIQSSYHPESGFFMQDFERLHATLASLEFRQENVLLLGVTYALLDFASVYPMPLRNTIVMETGGMKGRKTEMLRAEVHQILKQAFSINQIHSEYGMTELLSQAYSKGDGVFRTPNWMKVQARDVYNPLLKMPAGKTGALNITDLANVYSCAFVATDDIGTVYEDNSFEVLGRMDNSDVRGCSLMYGSA